MRHIALTVSYDGTHWCGSQRQPNGATIQGELERVLATLLKVPTPVTLAGRTDAGVHARGQVAGFATENQSLPVEKFDLALNALMHRSVRVRQPRAVEENCSDCYGKSGKIKREVNTMNRATATEVTPEKVAEYEATLAQYLSGMEQMQKEITSNRREIEQLRAETEVMLKNTLAVLKVAA